MDDNLSGPASVSPSVQGQKQRAAGAASNRGPIAVIAGALVVLVVCLITAVIIGRVSPSASKPAVQQPKAGSLVAPDSSAALTPTGPTPTSTSAPSATPSTVAPVANVAVRTSSEPPAAPPSTSAPSYPSGTYVDGPLDQPHYFITFNGAPGGMLGGVVDYAYQDGQTGVAFTFNGRMNGTVMTLYPSQVQTQPAGSPQIAGNVPTVISAVGDRSGFELGQCAQYLTAVQSAAECEFTP
jgi:hypothetical protein